MFAHLLVASAVVLASSSAFAAISVTQSITFRSIAPFGTYSDGQVVAGGWELNNAPVAFPFANPNDIETVKIAFDSTDAFYQAQAGPTPPPGGQPNNTHPDGGVPMVEVNFLNPARVGIVSLTKSSSQATLFEYGDPQDRFGITTKLLSDFANSGANPGNLGVRLGGFVSFYDDVTNQPVTSDDFTFGGLSTFTVTVTGTPTPEPATLVSLGAASLLMRRRR
jgi:hypothetical protein